MTLEPLEEATAFAPATVANVSVGFDVLGFALERPGDRVTVRREPGAPRVTIDRVAGCVPDLPLEAERNTAGVALLSLIERRRLDHGFRVSLHKGIPLGSGMGGSAASAVGAIVAASRLLDRPLAREEALACALAGEAAASGAPHADNAAPCLFGGLTAVVEHEPPVVLSVPVPDGVVCTLVHPHFEVTTRHAREALRREIPLVEHVAQSMHLAGFLAGCFRGDLERVGRSMIDTIAEPTRSALIPGFAAARAAALEAGALGFGIAGSGPSVFAWSDSEAAAQRVEAAVRQVFAREGLGSDGFVGPVARRGARIVGGRPGAAPG